MAHKRESEAKPVVICRSGKTEQECRDLYDKGVVCSQIYMIDTDSNEEYAPDNCMYYNQYMDWLVAEDERRNGPEESDEELEKVRKVSEGT